jgi:hypothetical protein
MEKVCIECKNTPQPNEYFDIDIGRICNNCFNINIKSTVTKPRFVKKVCLTHKCSSYNTGLMASHEMPWCDIVTVETAGVQKPKTQYDESLGGLNGNIGRHYYKDWTEYCQQKDQMIHAEKTWENFRNIHGRRKGRKPVAYY